MHKLFIFFICVDIKTKQPVQSLKKKKKTPFRKPFRFNSLKFLLQLHHRIFTTKRNFQDGTHQPFIHSDGGTICDAIKQMSMKSVKCNLEFSDCIHHLQNCLSQQTPLKLVNWLQQVQAVQWLQINGNQRNNLLLYLTIITFRQ